jgi:hypothetical protein
MADARDAFLLTERNQLSIAGNCGSGIAPGTADSDGDGLGSNAL